MPGSTARYRLPRRPEREILTYEDESGIRVYLVDWKGMRVYEHRFMKAETETPSPQPSGQGVRLQESSSLPQTAGLPSRRKTLSR